MSLKLAMEQDKQVITIKDIAAAAGVSVGTIDRVLHNRTDVSEKTRSRVLEIIDQMGYQTNIIAKTLASKKEISFGALIPGVDQWSSYWEKPLDGMNKAVAELSTYGVRLETFFYDLQNSDDFVEKAKQLLSLNPQGIVLAPVFHKEAEWFVQELQLVGIPYVFLDSTLEGDEANKGYVGHDSFQSGKVAAKLISDRIGSKDNILLVNLAKNSANQNHLSQRSSGFRSYFAEQDRLGALVEIEINQLDESTVNDKIGHILEQVRGVKALFVTSSKVHVVAKCLESNGMKDLILVGYDLIDENLHHLNMTTIDYLISQNPKEQGYRSTQKLFRTVVLRKDTFDRNEYLPISIVVKENVMYYTN